MSTVPLAWTALLAVLLFWAVGAYNRLVALRNAIGEAWRALEEPIEQRHALLPQLASGLAEAGACEPAAFEPVLAASHQAHAAALALRRRPYEATAIASLRLAEQVMAQTLARLQSVLERAPAEAAAPLAAARADLDGVEQRLAFRRQLFNQAAHRYNEALAQFPTRLLKPLFRFAAATTL